MEEFPITNSRLQGTKDFVLSSSPDWGSKFRSSEANNKDILQPMLIEREFNPKIQADNSSKLDNDNFFPEINLQNFSKTLFIQLFDTDRDTRENYLEEIISLFRSCFNFTSGHSQEVTFLSTHLTMIARLSTECPYKKISAEFYKLFEQIKEKV